MVFLHDKVPAAFIGWYLFLWGVFTLYMWVATWRAARPLQLLFFVLFVTFPVLTASEWTGLVWLHHAGGYCGLVAAVLAFYLSAAEIIDEMHSRNVLPVGTSDQAIAAATPVGSTDNLQRS